MDINAIAEKISASKKYRDICPDAVYRVTAECACRYKNDKTLEKAVREKLHGIAGAYLTLEDIRLPEHMDDRALEAILEKHASTRERLPLARMDDLYAKLFEGTGTPDSILDLACGLNPLYLKYRYPDCRVTGIDLSRRCAELTGGLCADLLTEGAVPTEHYDVALLFKILPLLERERAGAGEHMLRSVNATHIIASFPTRSLSGRNVGMKQHYTEWINTHSDGFQVITTLETENEMYVILK